MSYAGTQIGQDGKRYPIGDARLAAVAEPGADCVTTTGDQSIGGTKTFTGDVVTRTGRTQADARSYRTPQAALDALPSGGVLWVPPGITDGSLVLPSFQSVIVRGAGQTASTLRRTTPGPVISGTSVREATIENLKLDGANAASWGIDITSLFRSCLSHLWITGGTAGGVRLLTDATAGGLYYNSFSQVFVHLNALRGWHVEPHADGYANSNHFEVCTGSRTTGLGSANWWVKGLYNSTWIACTAEGAETTEQGFVATNVIGTWIAGLIERHTIYQVDTDPDGTSRTKMSWIYPAINNIPAGGSQLGQRHSKNRLGTFIGDVSAYALPPPWVSKLNGPLLIDGITANEECFGVKAASHTNSPVGMRNDGALLLRYHANAVADLALMRGAQNLLTITDGAGNETVVAHRGGRGTTAQRPSATAMGAGAQWFDRTLNRPIWSDGSAWRDAAGNAV